MLFFTLIDHQVTPCSHAEWVSTLASPKRLIRTSLVGRDAQIKTIFVGLEQANGFDHAHAFVTNIIYSDINHQIREADQSLFSATWDQAVKTHDELRRQVFEGEGVF